MLNKTTIAGFVAVIAGILSYFNLDLSSVDQQTITDALSGVIAAGGVICTAIGAMKSRNSKDE